ncbi:MAG: para-aminobenzoate synthetase component 1, partial [Phenylobacterium sp.]
MPEKLIVKKIAHCRLNSTQLFSFFAARPWAMLLDSANGDHIDSRFDIMVAEPKVKIITWQKETQITVNNHSHLSVDDPLSIIQQQIAAQLHITDNQSANRYLPFIGGAVGYFGYDLGGNFEALPHSAIDDINIPDMAVGIYDWAIIKDNHDQSVWFVSQGPSLDAVAPGFCDLIEAKVMGDARQCESAFAITKDWQANMNFASYSSKFDKIQQYLLSGDCYQVNLAQRLTAQ